MKLQGKITINGKHYAKGDEIPAAKVYPFFLIHMLMFGLSGFFMAYGTSEVPVFFLFMHGGFAIAVYLMFYLVIFGRDTVKWLLINSALGLFGIYTEIDWILSLAGKSVSDFSVHIHVIPFLYYILYTFLLRQAVLDMTGARADPIRRRLMEYGFVTALFLFYLLRNLFGQTI